MITTIIFDVGGVLHTNHNDFVKNDIAATLKISRDTADQVWQKLIPTQLGKGLVSEQEFWERFKKFADSNEPLPKESLLSREFIRHYEPIEGTIELTHHLKRNGYRLAILSDTIPNHADVAKEKGHFDAFDHLFLSYQVHLRKSDRDLKIFRLALKKLSSSPNQTVFIDDKAEYVADAQKLGIHAILFQNPSQLETNLRKLGIKTRFVPDREKTNIGCHAIIITPEGKLVLQQREELSTLINSGKISMFGGTIARSEGLEKGLAREIEEELGIKISDFPLKKLNTYTKTPELDGIDYTIHIWLIKNVPYKKLRLLEGAGFTVGTVDELLANPKLTRITRLALLDYQQLSSKP